VTPRSARAGGHVAADPRLDTDLLRVLADPLRAQVVTLLAAEQLCTSHLVELTGATQTNVSNVCAALRKAGLVVDEPCGRYSYHRLTADGLARLGAQLTGLARLADGLDERKRPCR
jgi:ArsR family transcriptional regulator